MKRSKILFIESDPHIRELYQEILKSERYLIHVCSNLSESYKELAIFKPQLILLDIDLPSGGALKLLKALENINPFLPVVLLSNYEEKVAFKKYLTLNSSNKISFLATNIIDPTQLIATVEKLLI